MTKNIIQLIGVLLLPLGPLLPATEPSSIKPINLGTRHELFIDDYLVESVQGLTWRMHEPTTAEVALQFDAKLRVRALACHVHGDLRGRAT